MLQIFSNFAPMSLFLRTYFLLTLLAGLSTLSFAQQNSGQQRPGVVRASTDTVIPLQNVTVKGQRQDNNNSIRTELKVRDIDQSRGQSLGEVLQRAVGVSVLQTGSTIFKPVIHGLHSQRILMLNNGVRQEGQQWGSEHAPEIDPFVADKFTVLKGAGALRYGPDAIAGAVLVEPRPLRTTPGTQGEANLGYFSNNRQWVANVQVEQGLKKLPGLSWRLQTTYKRGGNARTPDYWLYNTGLREFNYSGALAWRAAKFKTELFFSAFNTDLGIFMGSHIGNLTDLNNAINSPVPLQNIDAFSYDINRPRQAVQHYLLKSKTVWTLQQGQRLNLVVSHQENNRQEFDRALISDKPELDLSIGTTALDLVMEKDTKNAGQTQLGLTGMFQQNIWQGSRFYIPNFESYNLAGFLLHKWAKDRWLWEGGLRYDFRHLVTYRNQNNVRSSAERQFNNLSATLGATYLLGQGWKLLFNGALAWRPPQVNELYVNGLHHGAAIFEMGDSSLAAERAHNFSLQLNQSLDSVWEFDLTVYSNWINGFINLVPSLPPTLTLRGAYPTFRYVQTNAWLGGVDLQVRRHLGDSWQAGLKSALLWARDLQQNDWLSQMPPNRLETDLLYQWGKNPRGKTYVQARYIRVFEQSRVPQAIPDYLPPPPAYGLVNLDFATTFQFSGKTCNFGLAVTNLMNLRYRDYMNRFRYYSDEVGRSINLRLKINF